MMLITCQYVKESMSGSMFHKPSEAQALQLIHQS